MAHIHGAWRGAVALQGGAVGAGAQYGDFRVLGPLEVGVGGKALKLGGPQLRVVLALLVANAGHVVSLAALVAGLWEEHAPPDAARTVRTYVSRLRTALLPAAAGMTAGELIVTCPPGYALRLGPDAVDAARFERWAAAGRQALKAGQPAVAAERLAAALGLWRGDAYGEFDTTAALLAEGARLERLRLTAVQDRIEADLAAGAGGELIAELEGLIGRHPGHERLWGQLMTALYRTGRQTDALQVFQRAREVLIEESGLEPSPGLTEIQRQILAQDSRLLAACTAGPGSSPGARPAQLPPAVRAFAGRSTELAKLDAVLPGADGSSAGRPAAVVISAVSGTAGIGKTTLAVHWAHRVAAQFPDGQLYVNLRGFDPTGSAVEPATAVRGFLDAFGVPVERIPASLDAQTALYRSLLAGKRILVVLDNARDAEQVRPLLPGSTGCLVLVTSRNQLTPLVATEGAHLLTLDLLTAAEARDLLAHRLGTGRVAAEPEAVTEIIARCARLPLALAIAAARATNQPDFSLTTLARGLRQAAGQLDVFNGGDAATDVRAVFSWSYHTLSPDAARLFRLLGLHPGPDTSATAAASLAGVPAGWARRSLTELTRTQLLAEHSPGRYTFHDLLRAYAAEQAHHLDSDENRHTATRRLLDHYLHTAHTAALLLNPHRDPITLTPPQPGVAPEHLTDHQQALAWFTTEHRVLLAVINHAARTSWDIHTWQLAWTLTTFLNRRGRWHDWAATWQVALAAAQRLANPPAQATAHRSLGWVYTRLSRFDEAHRHLQHALDLYGQVGDQVGQADTHLDLGRICGLTDRNAEALDHAQQALDLYRAADHRAGQALALNNIGWTQTLLGDHQRGLISCQQALTLHQDLGNRDGTAGTWDSLGFAHHHLGHHAQAVTCYQHALDLYRDLGDRYEEAATLTNLGDTHQAAGHHDAARDVWLHALAILEDLNHPDAAQVRAKLPPSR